MTTVRILKIMAGADGVMQPGEVHSLDDGLAAVLIGIEAAALIVGEAMPSDGLAVDEPPPATSTARKKGA